MEGVGASPEIIGRQRQDPKHATDPVIGLTIAKKSAVSAVMLDHEEANQEPCRRQRHEKSEPVAELECHPHQEPAERKRARCEGKLESASPRIWIATSQIWPTPVAPTGCPFDFSPPLVLNPEEAATGLEIIDSALD